MDESEDMSKAVLLKFKEVQVEQKEDLLLNNKKFYPYGSYYFLKFDIAEKHLVIKPSSKINS